MHIEWRMFPNCKNIFLTVKKIYFTFTKESWKNVAETCLFKSRRVWVYKGVMYFKCCIITHVLVYKVLVPFFVCDFHFSQWLRRLFWRIWFCYKLLLTSVPKAFILSSKRIKKNPFHSRLDEVQHVMCRHVLNCVNLTGDSWSNVCVSENN